MTQGAAGIEQFKEIFGGVAPEFEKPAVWNTDDGEVTIPFQFRIENGTGSEKIAVFEINDKRSATLVRVDYSSHYGLKVRRQLGLHRKSGLFMSGEVVCDLGELTAVFDAEYSAGWYLRDWNAVEELNNPTKFKMGISVIRSGQDKIVPPLASASYNTFQNIPVDIVLPSADYDDAMDGSYEIREGQGYDSYRKTCFGWVNLTGARVETSLFGEEKRRGLEEHSYPVCFNSEGWVGLEGTAYEAKVALVTSGPNLERGRLRFFRRNQETGEEWMFSVPAWMYNNGGFMKTLKEKSIREFLSQYPVIFSVNGSDGKKAEVFTFSREDHPSKPL